MSMRYYKESELRKAFVAGYTLAANEWRHSEVCGTECGCEKIDYTCLEEWIKLLKKGDV